MIVETDPKVSNTPPKLSYKNVMRKHSEEAAAAQICQEMEKHEESLNLEDNAPKETHKSEHDEKEAPSLQDASNNKTDSAQVLHSPPLIDQAVEAPPLDSEAHGLSTPPLAELPESQKISFLLGDEVDANEVDNVNKFLEETDGKLAFKFDSNFNADCGHSMLDKFAARIHELKCDVKYLDREDMLPMTCLNYLYVSEIRTFDQMVRVLRYKVNKLDLLFDSMFDVNTIPNPINVSVNTDLSNYLKNEEVRDLSFGCIGLDFYTIQRLVGRLIDLCPRIVKFGFISSLVVVDEIMPDEIPLVASKYRLYINEIKDQWFANSNLRKFKITFDQNLICPKNEYSDSWLKLICKMPEFNEWTKQLSYRFREPAINWYKLRLEEKDEDKYQFGINLSVIYVGSRAHPDQFDASSLLRWNDEDDETIGDESSDMY